MIQRSERNDGGWWLEPLKPLTENMNLSILIVWSGQQSLRKTTGKEPRTKGEREEKAELLIVWVWRRNMSDVLLSMKLSCKSLSAPVVHTDKASFIKISLSLGESQRRQEWGARIFQIYCRLKTCLSRAESIQEEQNCKNGSSTTMKQHHQFTLPNNRLQQTYWLKPTSPHFHFHFWTPSGAHLPWPVKADFFFVLFYRKGTCCVHVVSSGSDRVESGNKISHLHRLCGATEMGTFMKQSCRLTWKIGVNICYIYSLAEGKHPVGQLFLTTCSPFCCFSLHVWNRFTSWTLNYPCKHGSFFVLNVWFKTVWTVNDSLAFETSFSSETFLSSSSKRKLLCLFLGVLLLLLLSLAHTVLFSGLFTNVRNNSLFSQRFVNILAVNLRTEQSMFCVAN